MVRYLLCGFRQCRGEWFHFDANAKPHWEFDGRGHFDIYSDTDAYGHRHDHIDDHFDHDSDVHNDLHIDTDENVHCDYYKYIHADGNLYFDVDGHIHLDSVADVNVHADFNPNHYGYAYHYSDTGGRVGYRIPES